MINYPELERVEALSKDLEYYYGPKWKDLITPTSACSTYCFRIEEVAKQDPYLLVAHHYTRYIGDLSGGQILKKIAEKALKPPVGKGLEFYDFEEIGVNDPYPFLTFIRALFKVLFGFIGGK